ncbi:chemotaxis protein CheW [Actomonas aquatica]|uniref:Chemotaxis protein CheW n=1 Tax=Actomonas aquatica TaxID=2866162 RepID=A0ABZ1C6D7_9BACT|nr:chemotaxis protein CheW [Opitutus sp. WL0086]WRQ86972.1 chemotaxis protein CheW [Opitutus sp. WL0086]
MTTTETASGSRRVLGLVRVGRVRLAVPAATLAEVVRGPLEVSALPQAPRRVLGTIGWHGRPVPLVDLADLVRGESEPAEAPRLDLAMVVRHGEGFFAVPIDEALGVVRARADEVMPFDDGGADALFRELFQPRAGGAPAAIVDWTVISARQSMRRLLAVATSGSDAADTLRADAEAARPHVLVRLWNRVLAIDAQRVRRVQRRPQRFDSEVRLGRVEGFLRMGALQVPVLDLGRCLGWQEPVEAAPRQDLIVVGDTSRQVAVTVQDVIAIEGIREGDVEPADEVGEQARAHVRGVWQSPSQGPVWVVGAASLEAMGLAAETAEGALHGGAGAEGEVDGLAWGNRSADLFLVVRLGASHVALAASEVAAVEAVPSNWSRANDDPLFGGLMELRGRAVKIYDLAAALALPAAETGAEAECRVVVLMRGEDGDCGWLVSSMDLLVRQAPRALPARGVKGQGLAAAFTASVRAEGSGWTKEVCVLDLPGLMAAVGAVSGAAAAA